MLLFLFLKLFPHSLNVLQFLQHLLGRCLLIIPLLITQTLYSSSYTREKYPPYMFNNTNENTVVMRPRAELQCICIHALNELNELVFIKVTQLLSPWLHNLFIFLSHLKSNIIIMKKKIKKKKILFPGCLAMKFIRLSIYWIPRSGL